MEYYTKAYLIKKMSILSVALQICGSLAYLLPETENVIGLREVVSHSDIFSRQFYSTHGVDVKENFVSSPIGASVALSMLTYGVDENLRKRLERNLLFCRNRNVQNHGMRALVNILNFPGDSQMGRLIFVDRRALIMPRFRLAMLRIFQTGIQTVDYRNPRNAIKTINTWWHRKSKSDSYNIISPGDVSNRTILVIANVVEFNSHWATTFHKEAKHLHHLYDENGRVRHHRTMYTLQAMEHRAFRSVGILFIQIPYQEADLSLVLIMSRNASETTILDHHFNLGLLFNMSRNANVDFNLPKLRIESTIDLTDFLVRSGIGDGFRSFTRITPRPLKFSSIKQKTYIEIDETTTRAISTTIITNNESKSKKPAAPEAPVHFKAEVPFYFAIVKHLNPQDYVVLFNGHYKNVN
ncbi:serpin B3 [Fopius arisanus]|uniref:Serpin B3 n=2 Tax=Fopius arisanus TaxID=64838 RepID=A0A9R1TS80_9HYME|nr:PREDICTED: serpin B3-like [Fopius arisanus]